MLIKYLSVILLLLTLRLSAQDDPNAKLGLTQSQIDRLCSAAIGRIPNNTDWGIPTIYEYIYGFERKPYPDFASRREAHEWLAKIWVEKYSCVYCKISDSITGSLDMVGLYHEKTDWVYSLYDPDWNIKADINRIRPVNTFLQVQGTVLDYLIYVAEEKPTREAQRNPSFKNSLLGMAQRIREYGGKRISEMTPEEIERNSK